MNFLVLLAITASLQFFGVSILIDYGTQISHNHKPSKGKVKGKAKPKPGKISTTSKPSDDLHDEKSYIYVIEVEKGANNDTKDEQRISGKKKARKLGDYAGQTPSTDKLCDYLGDEEELDIPGCGGSIEIVCNGGCINIHKVLLHNIQIC